MSRRQPKKANRENLQAASAGAKKDAPKTDVKLPCEAKKEVPHNLVTPSVTVVSTPGFHHPGQFHPAQVTVRIAESTGNPAYAGNGTVTVAGEAAIFANAGCNMPLVQPISAARLLAGVPVFVKGSNAGAVTVRIDLTPSANAQVHVLDHAVGAVAIEHVNVIKPVVAGDQLVLVHNGFDDPWDTTLSEITVSFTESHPGRAPADLAAQVDFGNHMSCSSVANPGGPFATGTSITRAQVGAAYPLRLRGEQEGDCTVATTATGAAGHGWRLEPGVAFAVRVQPLVLDVHQYADGGLFDQDVELAMAPAADLKTRELHQSNGYIFPYARFRMRKPPPAFWDKASRVTLAAHEGMNIFTDDVDVALTEVAEAHFVGDGFIFWAGTSVPATELEHPEPVAAGQLAPEKELLARYVSCGATIKGGKELIRGNVVELQTYSLDRELDRHVRNSCHAHMAINNQVDLNRDCALAKAEAHRLYDRRSTQRVNLCRNPHGAGDPFADFITAMAQGANNAARADRGANFVEAYLVQHVVVLAPAMKERIKAYILSVLNKGKPQAKKFGFLELFQVPGTHAECLAVNELMIDDIPADEITVATYRLQKPKRGPGLGMRFDACANCAGVLAAPVRVITG